MADTSFVDNVITAANRIVAAWLNQVNKWLFWGRRPNYATTTGSANAQVLTLETGSLYVAGSEADGDEFWFTAGFTNIAAMTMQIKVPAGTNVARAVQLNQQALVGGEVLAGSIYKVQRLGTTWQLFNLQQLVDGQPVVVGSADGTKKLRLSVSAFTSGVTRIVALADQNLTLGALTNAGDLWIATAAGVLTRLGVGTAGQALIADPTQFSTNKAGWGAPVLRNYLAGLQLNPVGSSATMPVSAGQAVDSTNVAMMSLASAINKTTSAWTVGTGNGGLDTGAIANGTWYHFFLIMRLDTSVVDVLFSLSATAPTMPANYTLKRRIGSGKTDGSAQWIAVIQKGNLSLLKTLVQDVAQNNPGTGAAWVSTFTLPSVPTGVQVDAYFSHIISSTSVLCNVLVNSLEQNDFGAISIGNGSAGINAIGGSAVGPILVRTDTSARVRVRGQNSDSNTNFYIMTYGWYDYLGRSD